MEIEKATQFFIHFFSRMSLRDDISWEINSPSPRWKIHGNWGIIFIPVSLLFFLCGVNRFAWESSTPNSKSLSVSSDPHSLLCIVLVVCYNYHRIGYSLWQLLSILAYLLWNNVVSRYSMIIIINLSIFIFHNFVSSLAQRFYYWPRLTQSCYILFCFFSKKNNECLKNLTLVKGGQEKEDQSQQIPLFRCSEWSNFKDLHWKEFASVAR